MSTSMASNSNTSTGKTPKKGVENQNRSTKAKTPSKGSKKSPSKSISVFEHLTCLHELIKSMFSQAARQHQQKLLAEETDLFQRDLQPILN